MIADQLKHREPRDSAALKGRYAPESTNEPLDSRKTGLSEWDLCSVGQEGEAGKWP